MINKGGDTKLSNTINLYGHNSAETAFIVDDYPYGFRLRTKIRYWIETTKHGDRFVSQTLNPKTGRWNKEKKSTYSEVLYLYQKENGHISYLGLNHVFISSEEQLDKQLERVDLTKLNPMQLEKIKYLRALQRTLKHVEFTVENVTYLSPEERAKKDEEQKEANKRINQLFAHEYGKI